MMNQTLGSRIAELRRKKNMTQEDLANALGVTPQAVSKWENDLSCPDITLLPQLARLFGVTTDELLGNTGHPETTLLPKEERKPIKDMILRVVVNSKAGDKVRVNLPMTLVQVGLQMGMQMPQVTGGHEKHRYRADFQAGGAGCDRQAGRGRIRRRRYR